MYSLKQITKNYVNGKQITEVLKGIDLDIAEGDFLAIMGSSGAGKTTLINHVLNNQEGYKCAVIVNDIGEVNIDAELIQKTGVVTQEDQNLVPLSNGCICCTLNVDLINQITDLCESGKYDYILIEASGICEPLPIAQSIAMLEGDEETPALCHLDNIATVVDALRLASEFGCGDDLLKKEVAEEDIENLLIQQIEFCSTIVLNKVDMVKPEQLDKVKAMIKVLQPKARIIETTYGKVAVGDILDTNSYTFEDTAESAGWAQVYDKDEEEMEEEHHHHHHHHHHHDHDHDHEHHDHDHEDHSHCDHEHGVCNCGHHHDDDEDEYGIGTFVYHSRRPFSQEKLQEFVNHWPKSVVRAKGIVWFDDQRDSVFVFEQAGVQISATEQGKWLTAFPKEQQELYLKEYPEAKKNWDDVYGDREIKLVFIGQHMDKEKITADLDKCVTQ